MGHSGGSGRRRAREEGQRGQEGRSKKRAAPDGDGAGSSVWGGKRARSRCKKCKADKDEFMPPTLKSSRFDTH